MADSYSVGVVGLGAMRKDATVMLCSTVAPSEAKSLGEQVLAAGLTFLDAPVSGGESWCGDWNSLRHGIRGPRSF